MSRSQAAFKIRQVIDLTGASEFLLRAWEDRYSAIKPIRTKTGRRLYTESDILKVRAMMALTNQGVRVGEIAQLSLAELNRMLKQNVAEMRDVPVNAYVREILTNAARFSWNEVRALIVSEKEKLQTSVWIRELILPLMSEMGRQVDIGNFSLAHEHILSAIVKENLSANNQTNSPKKRGHRIVLAAPEGDFHDISLMIANLVITELGANSLYLGPHMPMRELANVCFRYKATHLLLSSTTDKAEGAKDDYMKFLNFLDANLDKNSTLWLAGRNAVKYPISLKREYKSFHSFNDFEAEVRKCLN